MTGVVVDTGQNRSASGSVALIYTHVVAWCLNLNNFFFFLVLVQLLWSVAQLEPFLVRVD